MKSNRCGESGYVLLAVMLAVTLILVGMSIELPRIAQQIKREREEELVHRGKDYATAVKRFVHKNGGRYPLSVEQLEDTNHIRFLRKRYKDPITGESDWKMVHTGEAQIKMPTPNPGLSGPGGVNPGLSAPGAGINPPGTTPGVTPQPSGIAQLNPNPGGSTFGQPSPQGGPGNLGSLTTSNIGTGQTVGGGQIIGVASVSKKQSIKEFNDKDHYDEWYFVYDLRLEQSGGTGVTVAEPRIGSSTSGGSTSGTSSSTTPGGGSTTGTPGTQPPPAGTDSGQPQPSGTPQPRPQIPN